ncbi:CD151 antigen [Halictus rubicundus]|uniref:CD151 antigen n=1 Tax=Halictus rubicundus TaxID=77578 RepID=UPI004035D7E6
MNWNKFFTGEKHRGTSKSEDEPETEDEDVTDSNATVSTGKTSHFLGTRSQEVPRDHFSQKCIRTIFLTINAITFLAGIVGVVTSVWTLTDDRIMSRLIGHQIFLVTLLFVGLVGSLASLLGIISLVRKRKKYLKTYIFLCLLFLCAIFVTAISSFWIIEEILKNIQADMVTAMRNYDSSPSSRRSWDSTHTYLKCCGIQSSRDWTKYEINIPKSCCATVIEECINITEAVAFKSGCLQNAALLLKSHVHAISITALLIFLILLINLSLALCILRRLKKRRSSR